MGLWIVGVLLANTALWVGMYWQPEKNIKKLGRDVLCASALGLAVVIMGSARGNSAYKSALDGENPYHKEYVYRDILDGTKVLTDSIYVRE